MVTNDPILPSDHLTLDAAHGVLDFAFRGTPFIEKATASVTYRHAAQPVSYTHLTLPTKRIV